MAISCCDNQLLSSLVGQRDSDHIPLRPSRPKSTHNPPRLNIFHTSCLFLPKNRLSRPSKSATNYPGYLNCDYSPAIYSGSRLHDSHVEGVRGHVEPGGDVAVRGVGVRRVASQLRRVRGRPVRSGGGPGPRRGEVRGTHRDPLQAGHEGEGSHLLRQQAGAARSSAP